MHNFELSKPYLNKILSDLSAGIISPEKLAEKLTIQSIDLQGIRSTTIHMVNDFIKAIPAIVFGLSILALFFLISKISKNFIINSRLKYKHYSVGLLISRLVQTVISLMGILIALSIIFPSITTGDLFAVLSFGAIAIGFALRNIVNNYISGIFILLHEPFKIGDEIRYQNFEGKVEFIDTRTTCLKSSDGRRILIPNGEIYTNAITINTGYQGRFIEVDVGIACDADLSKAIAVILKILKNHKDILQSPEPEALVLELGDFKNILRARCWTVGYQINHLRAKSAILQEIKENFEAQHIEIPYQTQVVRIDNRSKA